LCSDVPRLDSRYLPSLREVSQTTGFVEALWNVTYTLHAGESRRHDADMSAKFLARGESGSGRATFTLRTRRAWALLTIMYKLVRYRIRYTALHSHVLPT
jgi:hypothetical protein